MESLRPSCPKMKTVHRLKGETRNNAQAVLFAIINPRQVNLKLLRRSILEQGHRNGAHCMDRTHS